jgi:hypothetical protein
LHPQTVRKALHLLTKHRFLLAETRKGKTTVYRLAPVSAWRPTKYIEGSLFTVEASAPDSQESPTKPVGRHPSEKDIGEGSPSEETPTKATQPRITHHLPSSEQEAIGQAEALGIPADFARQEFNRMEAVGWLDGCRRPVVSWPHYLKLRAESHGFRRAVMKRSTAPPRDFKETDYHQRVEDF